MPFDLHLPATLARNWCDFNIRNVRDRQRVFSIFHSKLDRHRPHTDNGPDMRRQARRMATALTAEYFHQAGILVFIGTVVDIDGNIPRRRCHMARRMHRKRHVQPRERYAFVFAVFDVPADQRGTFPVCRRAEKQAGTGDIAIAAFEIGSLERPCHRGIPSLIAGLAPT